MQREREEPFRPMSSLCLVFLIALKASGVAGQVLCWDPVSAVRLLPTSLLETCDQLATALNS